MAAGLKASLRKFSRDRAGALTLRFRSPLRGSACVVELPSRFNLLEPRFWPVTGAFPSTPLIGSWGKAFQAPASEKSRGSLFLDFRIGNWVGVAEC